MATPLEIKILLHYWTCHSKYGSEGSRHANSDVVIEAKEEFATMGLLTPRACGPADGSDGADYVGNREALELYVNALCAVPLPQLIWTLPKEGE